MKYSFVSFLIAWIFPTKEDRSKFRKFCHELDNRKQVEKIQNRYPDIIEKLQNKIKNKQRIKVVFLNSENSKWSYQALYEQFDNSPLFDVEVLITIREDLLKKEACFLNCYKAARANYNFFKEREMKVKYAFDFKHNKYIDLEEFFPDIIFYEQPWALSEEQSIIKTSKYALCLYNSYGSAITNGENEYCESFYKEVYTYFIDNPIIENILLKHNFNSNNLKVVGNLKLDAYLKPIDEKNIIWKTENKKRIIYAPHHSFYDDSMLRFGTFDWNYKFFYNFAKEHQEYEFIFKPHPELKRQMVKQELMSIDEAEQYFELWQQLPNAQVYEFGNYFDMFRTSDLLITDCNSFLYEYFPTAKPVLHLINKNSVGHNAFGQKIISGYYEAQDIETIKEILKLLLVENQDTMKNVRLNNIKNLTPNDKVSVAEKIYNNVSQMVKI